VIQGTLLRDEVLPLLQRILSDVSVYPAQSQSQRQHHDQNIPDHRFNPPLKFYDISFHLYGSILRLIAEICQIACYNSLRFA
jgi:hypothetical protein